MRTRVLAATAAAVAVAALTTVGTTYGVPGNGNGYPNGKKWQSTTLPPATTTTSTTTTTLPPTTTTSTTTTSTTTTSTTTTTSSTTTTTVAPSTCIAGTVAVGDEPVRVAVSPVDDVAYVINIRAGTVSVIDTTTNTETSEITIPGGAFALALSPDGGTMYVGGPGTVTPVDTASNTVGTAISVSSQPGALAFSPTGDRLYVGDFATGAVSVVDTQAKSVLDTFTNEDYGFPVAIGVRELAVSPSGLLYLGFTDAVLQFALVVSFNPATSTVVGSLEIDQNPRTMEFNSAGTILYLTTVSSDIVWAIDTSAPAELTALWTFDMPENIQGAALNAAETLFYVAMNTTAEMKVLNVDPAGTREIVETQAVGNNPRGVTISALSGGVFVPNADDDTVSVFCP